MGLGRLARSFASPTGVLIIIPTLVTAVVSGDLVWADSFQRNGAPSVSKARHEAVAKLGLVRPTLLSCESLAVDPNFTANDI